MARSGCFVRPPARNSGRARSAYPATPAARRGENNLSWSVLRPAKKMPRRLPGQFCESRPPIVGKVDAGASCRTAGAAASSVSPRASSPTSAATASAKGPPPARRTDLDGILMKQRSLLMRAAICSFFFLALASLMQAQLGLRPGQLSCEGFSAHRNLLINSFVRPALDRAMPGKKVMIGGGGGVVDAQPPDWPAIKMLGDGTSVGVLKTVSPQGLTKPEFVKAYLKVIRIVFSEPQWIVCAEDKTPEVTVFLLDYLREKVEDKELQREIDSTKEYVLKQAGPPRQSPIEVPSQSAK